MDIVGNGSSLVDLIQYVLPSVILADYLVNSLSGVCTSVIDQFFNVCPDFAEVKVVVDTAWVS